MHEMSLATELIHQVLGLVDQYKLTELDKVEIEVGVLRQVVPEAMHIAWETLSEGTPAEGSKLILTETKASAECRQCSCVFEPEIDNYLCPECGQANIEIQIGNEIILKSLSGNTPEGESAS